MMILISPAKSLNFEHAATTEQFSQPRLLDQSEKLVEEMLTRSPDHLEKLMKISPKLAELNVERFQAWSRPFNINNAKQAVFAFQGNVYQGLDINQFTEKQLNYAQQNLRILSGLYGLLRPLDLIQAYRLEMGTKLPINEHKNLYQFWGEHITNNIIKDMEVIDLKMILNLASNEYYKAVHSKRIQQPIVSPIFKDWKNGQYKMISFYAKKARGRMSAWVLKNQVKSIRKLQTFDVDGYQFSQQDSTEHTPVFARKQTV